MYFKCRTVFSKLTPIKKNNKWCIIYLVFENITLKTERNIFGMHGTTENPQNSKYRNSISFDLKRMGIFLCPF